jgi:N-methylhydantoinase A/oxoprolinase/acetone carboxylase beta subunit
VSNYFKDFVSNFEEPEKLTLRIMKSNGGFDQPSKVRASELLLSGPAGGLIGYQALIKTFEDISKT